MNHNTIVVRVARIDKQGYAPQAVKVVMVPDIPTLRCSLANRLLIIDIAAVLHGKCPHEVVFTVKGKVRRGGRAGEIPKSYLQEISERVDPVLDKLVPNRKSPGGPDCFSDRDLHRYNEERCEEERVKRKSPGLFGTIWEMIKEALCLNRSGSGGIR